MAETDVLNDMMADAVDAVVAAEESIEALDAKIAEEQEKQEALEFVMDNCCTDLVDNLLPHKGSVVYTYADFNLTNATDWYVGEYQSINAVQSSPTTFIVPDNVTGSFSTGQVVLFFDGVDHTHSTVNNSSYDSGPPSETTIEMNESVVPGTIIDVAFPTYVYEGIGWDSDEEIQARIDEYNYSYDFVIKPVGLEGTYGTQDMIAKLTDAKGMVESNKNKAADAGNKLARYS